MVRHTGGRTKSFGGGCRRHPSDQRAGLGSVTNSFEAVRLSKQLGVGAYLGASCTETDLSARVSVHVSGASEADMQLAKPDIGVDEALTIVGNEQNRLLTTLRAKKEGSWNPLFTNT
jgi:methylaspartate ammonia-lyase